MDIAVIALIVASLSLALSAFSLRRRAKHWHPPEGKGEHQHRFDTMLADGKWRCGICGDTKGAAWLR